LVAGEGAGAVLVKKAAPDSNRRVWVNPDSFSFRTRSEQKLAWEQILQNASSDSPWVLPASIVPSTLASGLNEFRRIELDWGAVFTASAAWNFLLAEHEREKGDPFQFLVPGANYAVTSVAFR
jgi:hypothetical protein